MKKWKVRKNIVREIALERIDVLTSLAQSVWPQHPLLAYRYNNLAFKILQKTKVKLPYSIKKRFCRRCLTPFIEGETCSTTVLNDIAERKKCLVCGYSRVYKVK
jgi:ribonuclease P protein subunit RPR2